MDGTSPGNMPVSLGEVWVGTTACAPAPLFVTVGALCGGTVGVGAMQACVPHPGVAPVFQPPGWYPRIDLAAIAQDAGASIEAVGRELSEADVERIAQRVAAILREAKP